MYCPTCNAEYRPGVAARTYDDAWAEYTSIRSQILFCVLALALALATGEVLYALTGRTGRGGAAYGIVVFALFGATVIALLRAAQWRCPRCNARNPFRLKHSNIPAGRCYRCGLRKYEGAGSPTR